MNRKWWQALIALLWLALPKTAEGEVFLGHSEPERIVHDLDAMKQFTH